jgi:integrase
MAKLHLTDSTVDDLPPAAAGQAKYRVCDTQLPGFHVVVFASGTKTYYVRYTDPRGRPRDMTLGKHGVVTAADARRRARKLRAQASDGRDPAEERRRLRAIPTVAAFISESFLPHARASIRSHGEYEGICRLHIVPALGRLRLDAVTPADVLNLGNKLARAALSHSRVNRVMAVLRRLFNLAIEWRVLEGRNPAQSPRMLPENIRDAHLGEAELRALLTVLARAADQTAARAITLLALTGARKAEILHARWSNVDFDLGVLTVRADESKSRRTHRIRLSDAALAVLRLQHASTGGGAFVFPSARAPGKPLDGVRAAWSHCKAAAGIAPDFRLHDLRHTFATHCLLRGAGMLEVSRLLGHSSVQVTERYSHASGGRLAELVNLVARAVEPELVNLVACAVEPAVVMVLRPTVRAHAITSQTLFVMAGPLPSSLSELLALLLSSIVAQSALR